MTIVQRTPNLALKIRLQPITKAAPLADPAPPAAGGLQVAWTSAALPYTFYPLNLGTTPGAGDPADLHTWRQGAPAISPVSAVRGWADIFVVATVFNAPAGSTIAWSLDTDSSAAEIMGGVDNGVACVIQMYDPGDYDTHSLTLSATVDGVAAGSGTLYWMQEAS